MRGYPKRLNDKADYEYVRANFERDLWLPDWKALLDTMSDWFFVADLSSSFEGIEDETHKIIESEDTETGEKKYAQYELRVNPTCALLKLGFTKEEVEAAIR